MKENLTHSLPAKIIAFILLIITACTTLASALGVVFMLDSQSYTRGQKEVLDAIFSSTSYADAQELFYYHMTDDTEGARAYCAGKNISYTISAATSPPLENKDSVAGHYSYLHSFDGVYRSTNPSAGTYVITDPSLVDVIPRETIVQITIDDTFPHYDKYAAIHQGVTLLYDLRYGVIGIFAISAIAALGCFLFLLCAAGHKKGVEGIVASRLTRKLPFDLHTAIILTALFLLTCVSYESLYNANTILVFLGMGICFVVALIVGTLYCMNFAVRVKLGKWWENTLIYRFGGIFLRGCKKVLRASAALVHSLPLIWKTAVFCALFAFASLITVMIGSDSARGTIWLFAMVILLPAFLYIALMLRKLQAASHALASGDLSFQVDTSKMIWDFQDAGENLNQISVGMAHAVEERLKSERFKTELITNVSHDIKTPLTSIINYADLIGKEESANPKIAEYSAVLLRQSERLKKLIEDLVEASKASSGSTEVLLSPCELGVLLTQTVGEYEQKLSERELTLIVTKPETPITIMADGRLLWRVFDNLMSNVYKYAQSGTRVYLSLEERRGRAVIVLKNTSSYPLNLSPEELMERFVRGDASRHSEGNGLGLSIAQSLTELQNGRLALSVDGDLFKVTLGFEARS